MNPFIETEQILILDGATGTALADEGLPAGCSVEGWVLEHPDAIQRVQSGYVAAGSDVEMCIRDRYHPAQYVRNRYQNLVWQP